MFVKPGAVLKVQGKEFVLVSRQPGRRPEMVSPSDPSKVYTIPTKANLEVLATGETNDSAYNAYLKSRFSKSNLALSLKPGDIFIGNDGGEYVFFEFTGKSIKFYVKGGETYSAKPGFIKEVL